MAVSMDKSALMRLVPVAIFAALAVAFAIALYSGDPSKLPSALVGKAVPQTTFPPVEGLAASGKPVPGFTTADLARGKPTVVNFWASWCAPCVEEYPLLDEIKSTAGVDIYGVNYKDSAAAARRFVGRFGNPFTAVGTDATGRSAIDWGVYGMPETFVVDGNGVAVFKHVGPITEESLKSKLLPAIEKAKTASASPAPATPATKP
jgi:cytochrome c biogenesis protein CcmG/thiol:disulfide interchange protein DsbE